MNIPIVTLDRIYVIPDNKNIFFIDCTRINGLSEIVTRKGEKIDDQIEELTKKLSQKKIILADDVVFSGTVLKEVIRKFELVGIDVVGIISSISTRVGYDYFNENLKYGLRTNYLMENNCIDQICERDFYFGIAGSGILVKSCDGLYKAPYFKPFGNPNERASIPVEAEDNFSKSCLFRSKTLWEELDKINQRTTYIRDLPEKIINTNEEESIVKTLKKEIRNI